MLLFVFFAKQEAIAQTKTNLKPQYDFRDDMPGYFSLIHKLDSLIKIDTSNLSENQKTDILIQICSIGVLHISKGDYLPQIRECLYLTSKNNNIDGYLEVLKLALRVFTVNSASDSLKRQIQNLKILNTKWRDVRLTSVGYRISATINNLKGNYVGAISDLQKAIAILLPTPYKAELTNTYFQLAFNVGMVSGAEKTIELNRKAYQLLLKYDTDPSHISGACNNIANVFLYNGKLDSAKYYLYRAIKVARLNTLLMNYQNSLLALAIVYKKEGKNKAWAETLKRAYMASKFIEGSHLKVVSSIVYAESLIELGNPSIALPILISILDTARRLNTPNEGLQASKALFNYYNNIGQYRSAYYYDSLYRAFEIKSFGNEAVITAQKLESKFDEIEKEHQSQEISASLFEETKRIRYEIIGGGVVLIFVLGIAFSLNQLRKINKKLISQNHLIDTKQSELVSLNDTKNKMFQIITHDLRGPIGSLEKLPEIIEWVCEEAFDNHKTNEIENGSDVLKNLDQITGVMQRTTDNIGILLENLLEWSTSQQTHHSITFTFWQLKVIMGPTVDLFKHMLSEKNIIFTENVSDDVTLYADQHGIATAVRNLLSNAIKYTHFGGIVQLKAYTKGQQTTIIIIDNGIGMSESQLESAFLPVHTKQRKGTFGESSHGLGLLLVKDLVEKNKGTIHISSLENEGTTITLVFPATPFGISSGLI